MKDNLATADLCAQIVIRLTDGRAGGIELFAKRNARKIEYRIKKGAATSGREVICPYIRRNKSRFPYGLTALIAMFLSGQTDLHSVVLQYWYHAVSNVSVLKVFTVRRTRVRCIE